MKAVLAKAKAKTKSKSNIRTAARGAIKKLVAKSKARKAQAPRASAPRTAKARAVAPRPVATPPRPTPTRAKAKTAKAPAKRAAVSELRNAAPAPKPAKRKSVANKPAARIALGAATAPAAAPSNGAEVGAGATAPSFELSDEDGNPLSARQLAGKPYVLYFYPKDDTPGCTAQACGFRDALNRFSQRGVRVIGVSPDSPQTHTKFKQKYGLNFTLLSDADKVLSQAYGVWAKKSNYGREYMGIERSTFLIDESGAIKKVWRKVRVPGHVDAVLTELGT
ncbi:MAG TPA: thioredoxin-dependent thiol peroxidase [Polyangiaceae bacterium]